MTNFSLHRHPMGPSDSIKALTVTIDRPHPHRLCFTYHLEGDLSALAIPIPSGADFCDGLWQHTCFEAFIACGKGADYFEFNFSPSGQWAAYAFSEYRQKRAWSLASVPVITSNTDSTFLTLAASVTLPELATANRLRVGLTAVIKTGSGELSYWSLRHSGPRPDFHNAADFLITI